MIERLPPPKRLLILDKIKYVDYDYDEFDDEESHHRTRHNHIVECFEEKNSIGVKKMEKLLSPLFTKKLGWLNLISGDAIPSLPLLKPN